MTAAGAVALLRYARRAGSSRIAASGTTTEMVTSAVGQGQSGGSVYA